MSPPPGNTPPQLPATAAPTGRRWYIDEIVVAAFAFLGFGAGVFLPLYLGFNSVPPIMVSFLLATGIAALTYRYLGGIEGASFKVGALKLGGTLAALVGVAMVINSQLVRQTEPARVWYLKGMVLDETKQPISDLNDQDFQVAPTPGHAEQLGNFHVEFIRDTTAGAAQAFLTVSHSSFGPKTIPLVELEELKKQVPDAKVRVKDNTIQIDQIILHRLPNSEPNQIQVQPLQQGQVGEYTKAAQAAQSSGGGPQ